MAPGRLYSADIEDLPPFPADIPTAPLFRVSLQKLLDRDAEEESRLFEACRTYGFFYLDLSDSERGHELIHGSETFHALSKEAFKLPRETKESISFAKTGTIFGWKASGAVAKDDKHQRSDRGEFWNVAKNHVMGITPSIDYPDLLTEEMQTFRNFTRLAHDTGMIVLDVLARKLGIEPELLKGKHKVTEPSGDHVRLTWGPAEQHPNPNYLTQSEKETKITTYAHTDFGSVTLLWNWLGGLQVESKETGKWEWVIPVENHAICNLGDAMVDFSGDKVTSGKHRVINAPGDQALSERYSIVYFIRPEDDVYLEDLTETKKTEGKEKWKAGDWIIARAKTLGNKLGDDDDKEQGKE